MNHNYEIDDLVCYVDSEDIDDDHDVFIVIEIEHQLEGTLLTLQNRRNERAIMYIYTDDEDLKPYEY